MSNSSYLSRVVEGIWTVSAGSLGENHLMTQAFETALRSGDDEMMERALHLLGGSPVAIKERILWGSTAKTAETGSAA